MRSSSHPGLAYPRPRNDRLLWRPVLLAPHGKVVEKSEVLVSLLFPHADTHCPLGRPTGVEVPSWRGLEHPGTLSSIRSRYPIADIHSDLAVVSGINTALRKSERIKGTETIRRTNWRVFLEILVDLASQEFGTDVEGGTKAIAYARYCVQHFLTSHGPQTKSVSPREAHTSDRARSPIALRRELLGSLTTQDIRDDAASVLA